MFKLTTALKSWLVEHRGIKADATDAEFRKAAYAALADEKSGLTDEKLLELTTEKDAEEASVLEKALGSMAGAITKLAEASGHKGGGAGDGGGTGTATLPAGTKGGGTDGGKPDPNAENGGSKPAPSYFEKIFAGSDGIGSHPDLEISAIRVKGAHERFSDKRREKTFGTHMGAQQKTPHPYAGQRMFVSEGGEKRYIDEMSQLDMAIAGAFLKFQLQNDVKKHHTLRMTQQEQELMQYALRELPWSGTINGDGENTNSQHLNTRGQKLTPSQQKAIIDDATSGGLEAAPIFFDDAVITTPLLYGEFFPSVNVVPITRGRRIEGFSMGNLTLSGGGADGTDITLFTTTAFIAAFDTTIYAIVGAVEIGLDFMSDSPVDVGGMLTEQYGRVLLNFLDRAVANGDGTTEPTGIVTASGTISVAGGSAAPTVGVYESFFFGVTKKYKQGFDKSRIMFGANETTYSRARSIAVSGSDARRIFGMTHGDYMLMGHNYGISDELGNTKAFFANMARYRMYRRMGQQTKVTTEGKTLVRQNMMLLTTRSRWGGQPEDGAAFAVSSTMQA